MKKILHLLLAGLGGGIALSVGNFLTFGLIGSGLDHKSGILFNPRYQSPKVIAVWTQYEPLPLIIRQPLSIPMIFIFLGIVHSMLYILTLRNSIRTPVKKVVVLTIVLLTGALFFEIMGPLNLLNEPIGLISLELSFWTFSMLLESLAIVYIFLGIDKSSKATINLH